MILGKRSRSPWTQAPWMQRDPRTSAMDSRCWRQRHQRLGRLYRAATDTKIAIHGKKALKGYTSEGSKIRIDVQIADVKKDLGISDEVK